MASTNPNRVLRDGNGKVKKSMGQTHFRTKATINRLNMYKSGAPIRNTAGKIVGGDLMGRNKAGNQELGLMSRIAPNRKWFGNTRVIGQRELEKFRDEMKTAMADPYSVVLKRRTLPMGLLSS